MCCTAVLLLLSVVRKIYDVSTNLLYTAIYIIAEIVDQRCSLVGREV